MDISVVHSKDTTTHRRRQKRTAPRRHTTEVRFDQLSPNNSLAVVDKTSSTSLSSENLNRDGHHNHIGPDMVNGEDFSHPSLDSSWNSIEDNFDQGYSYFESSQADALRELNEITRVPPPSRHHLDMGRHQYQLSYELALDNVLTPFVGETTQSSSTVTAVSPLQNQQSQMSKQGHVIQELVTTETTYTKDLTEIIEGYFLPLQSRVGILPLKNTDLKKLFGNIQEIQEFHQVLLHSLKSCDQAPEKIGQCFLSMSEHFKMYTQYCNNYPSSIRVLSEISREPLISRFLKTCQQRLNHMLPLGAHLLKPVQRVLKYSLLLHQLGKTMKVADSGYDTVHQALLKMTEVAEHINAMKKKYDAAVHIQEVQSLIRGTEGLDLSRCGELVLEENFRYSSGKVTGSVVKPRTERYVFLFQKLCLITKKEEDGYQFKTLLQMKDLQLTEKMEKVPTGFQIRQVSTGRSFTFLARSVQQKDLWATTIKKLLMESIPHLPDKAKQMIMQGFEVGSSSGHSPKRDRHRHHSEEPTKSPSLHHKGRSSLDQTKTLGRLQSTQDKKKTARLRSSTSPALYMQGGLISALVASIHSPPRSGTPEDGESISPMTNTTPTIKEDPAPSPTPQVQSTVEKRDETFSETMTTSDVERLQPKADDETEGNEQQNVISKRGRHSQQEESPHHTAASPLEPQHFLQSSCSSPQLMPGAHPNDLIDTISDKLKRTSPMSKLNLSDDENSTSQNGGVITSIEWDTSGAPVIHGSQNLGGADDIIPIDVMSTIPPPIDDGIIMGLDNAAQTTSSPESTLVPSEIDHLTMQLNATLAPDVEIQIGDSNSQPLHFRTESNITEDDESLFNELMDSTSDLSNVFGDPLPPPPPLPDWNSNSNSVPNSRDSSLSRSDASLIRSLLSQNDPFYPSQESVDSDTAAPISVIPPREFSIEDEHLDDNAVTPKASPFASPSVNRRWSAKRRVTNGVDFDVTPRASPHVSRHDTIQHHHHQQSPSRLSREVSPLVIDPPTPFREAGRNGGPYLDVVTSAESPSRENKDEDSSSSRKSSSSSIVRRHSYGANTKRVIVHKREGSRSTDNSPPLSPKRERKKKSKHRSPSSSSGGVQRRGSFNNKNPPISVIGLVSTTMTDLELVEDLPSIQVDQYHGDEQRRTSIILPPPTEFVSSPPPLPDGTDRALDLKKAGSREFSPPGPDSVRELDSPNSERQRLGTPPTLSRESSPKPDKDTKSLFRLTKSNRKHSKTSHEVRTPTSSEATAGTSVVIDDSNLDSPVTPYESNPNEMMSFDEMLTSFSDFAEVTGKTMRTMKIKKEDVVARSHSPQPVKRKKEKKKRRSQTVANIDAETMRQVNEMMKEKEAQRSKESPPVMSRQRSENKVYQLAREYSQKIKNHQRSRIFKRFSTVVEEPPEFKPGELPDPSEPSWLQDLREKRRSRRFSQEDLLEFETEMEQAAASGSSNHNLGTSHSLEHLPLSHSPSDRKKMSRSKSSTSSKPRAHTLGRLTAEEVASITSSPKTDNNRRFRSSTPDSEKSSLNGEADPEQQRKKRFGWVRSFFNKDKNKE